MGIRDLYNKTLTIKRETVARDVQGSSVKTWTTVGTMRGRCKPANAKERLAASQYGAEISHVVFCDASEDVGRGDHIESGALLLRVVDVRNPGGMDHHLEVDAMEEQHGQ